MDFIRNSDAISVPGMQMCVYSSGVRGGGGVHLPIYGVIRMCGPNSSLFSARKVYEWPYFLSLVYE